MSFYVFLTKHKFHVTQTYSYSFLNMLQHTFFREDGIPQNRFCFTHKPSGLYKNDLHLEPSVLLPSHPAVISISKHNSIIIDTKQGLQL